MLKSKSLPGFFNLVRKTRYSAPATFLTMGNCFGTISSIIQSDERSDVPRSLSPYYDTLPDGAKMVKVKSVYDGDTVTLEKGNIKVRLLGVDAPELRENQAYAIEARDYITSHCLDLSKQAYTSCGKFDASQYNKRGLSQYNFESSSGDKKDRYGRTLSYLWVEDKGRYLNLCEGLGINGLASAYMINLKHPKLIDQQKYAREHKIGMWKYFQDFGVIRTPNGTAFHQNSKCKYLSRSKVFIKTSAAKAMDDGLNPCRSCLPEIITRPAARPS